MTNLLGSEEWGDYSYAVSWLTNLVLFGRFGFNKSATRFLAVYTAQKDWPHLRGFLRYSQSTMYKASLGISLAVTLLLLVFSGQIKQFFGGNAFYHCMLIAMSVLPFLAHLEIVEGILDGYKRVVLSQIPMRITRPALIALLAMGTYFLLPIGRDASGKFLAAETAMIITLASVLTALGIAFYLLKKTYPSQAHGSETAYKKQEWFSTSRDMMLTSSFNLLLVSADVTMLGIMISTEAAGIYTGAARLALLLIIALTAVNAILQPIAASLYSQKKMDELQRMVSLGANAIFAISLIGSIILYFGAEFLVALFGEEDFQAAAPLLRILIVGQLFNAFAGPSVLLLNMTGHQRDAARIMAGGALLNFILNGILIALIGIEGAAYASVTTNILWNIAAAIVVWYRLRIFTPALRFARTKS